MITTAALPVVSPRIGRLQRRLEARLTDPTARFVYDLDEVHEYWTIAAAAYAVQPQAAPILRKARFLFAFADQVTVHIDPDEPIIGSMRFVSLGRGDCPPRQIAVQRGFGSAGGHIIVNYGLLPALGASGLRARLDRCASRFDGRADARVFHEAAALALQALSRYIARHAEAARALGRHDLADDLETLTTGPARTFRQALQLVRVAQVLLHAEDPSAAISFGRLDQCLWPYLKADLAAGRLTLEEAFELVCAFWLKCHEGEESQNVAVGGQAVDGSDQTNPLSLLMIEATRALRAWQPSLSVRCHPAMPEALQRGALALAQTGTGQPSFFNDPVVIASLEAAGLPSDRAADYGIVGCYEATPHGDTYGMTVLACFPLVESLWRYVTGPARWEDFGAFMDGLKAHLHRDYAEVLAAAQARWNHAADRCPSPLKSLLLDGCLEAMRPAEAGGARFNYAGINVLGLGTLVDSGLVIEDRVFRRRDLQPGQIVAGLLANWPDEPLRLELKNHPGKYGSDSPRSNALAAELSAFLARLVLASRMERGVRPYPGLFAFGGDIHRRTHPSPDGRRREDFVSYGIAPSTIAPAQPATAILHAASHVAQRLCACGCPLTLSLSPREAAGPRGRERLAHLLHSYFRLGGFHLHFNVVGPDTLREAQVHPQSYADLLVRVSGFSARFVALDRAWQDALIARTERGM